MPRLPETADENTRWSRGMVQDNAFFFYSSSSSVFFFFNRFIPIVHLSVSLFVALVSLESTISCIFTNFPSIY